MRHRTHRFTSSPEPPASNRNTRNRRDDVDQSHHRASDADQPFNVSEVSRYGQLRRDALFETDKRFSHRDQDKGLSHRDENIGFSLPRDENKALSLPRDEPPPRLPGATSSEGLPLGVRYGRTENCNFCKYKYSLFETFVLVIRSGMAKIDTQRIFDHARDVIASLENEQSAVTPRPMTEGIDPLLHDRPTIGVGKYPLGVQAVPTATDKSVLSNVATTAGERAWRCFLSDCTCFTVFRNVPSLIGRCRHDCCALMPP